jgi:hypothetical protein
VLHRFKTLLQLTLMRWPLARMSRTLRRLAKSVKSPAEVMALVTVVSPT